MNSNGCLLIPEPTTNAEALSVALERAGLRVVTFEWTAGRGLHDRLLKAYQAARGSQDMTAIAAIGAGWDAALAIACQLPVTRIALIGSGNPGARAMGTSPLRVSAVGAMSSSPDERLGREYRRVRAFARRNAAFCVADILVLAPPERVDGPDLVRLQKALCNCRVYVAEIAEERWRNDKEVLNMAVSRFLSGGVLPKSLAENPEMCIIYG